MRFDAAGEVGDFRPVAVGTLVTHKAMCRFGGVMSRSSLVALLFASSTSRFDATRISMPEAVARFAAGILLIAPQPQICLTGAVPGLALLDWNRLRPGRTAEA